MSFWMTNAVDYDDREVAYDNFSKIERIRPHQWFMDGSELELCPNRKQAIEVPVLNPFSLPLYPDICHWGDFSRLQPATSLSNECLYDLENVPVCFDERNIQLVSSCNTYMDGKLIDDSCTSMGLFYNGNDDNMISVNEAYNSVGNGYVSMGQSYNKMEDPNRMDGSSRKCNNILATNLSSSEEDDNNRSLGSSLQASDVTTAINQSFSKADDSALSMVQNFIRYQKNDNVSINNADSKLNESAFPMPPAVSGDSDAGKSFAKRESNFNSFGGQDDDGLSSSGRHICNYELLIGRPVRGQTLNEQCLVKSNIRTTTRLTKMTSTGSVLGSKTKEEQNGPKKFNTDIFPSNARTLFSTGMLEGVPVKYIARSQQVLHGIIRSCGYLCGCQSCNLSKVIKACEFERHAGCKTNHPNKHIYLESGKTVFRLVQELRNTPRHLLFEVIQTITGSTINQKAFQIWRGSFEAAPHELQRIDGKGDGKQYS